MNADNSVHLFLSFNKRTSKYYILFIEHINLTQMVDFYSFGEIQGYRNENWKIVIYTNIFNLA